MPPRFPKIFLSTSFRPEDATLIDWFRDLIAALDFEVIIANHPEPRPPPEKIRADIGRCDGFAALLTRRDKLAEEGKWTAPAWVHAETGIAHELRKPVIAFLEEGVDADGLVPWITDYVRFDRGTLADAAPRIARYLVSARSTLVPRVELLEELPTVRALANELFNEVVRIARIDRKPEKGFRLSLTAAQVSGRVFTIPADLRDALEAANGAIRAVNKCVDDVKKHDPLPFRLKPEKPDEEHSRLAKRAQAMTALIEERARQLPTLARAAAIFARVAFPEQDGAIELCDDLAGGGNDAAIALAILAKETDEGADGDRPER